MLKVFLDTNIILDFLSEREDFYEPAAKILTLADMKKIHIFTSPTSIGNAHYILTRYEGVQIAMEKLRKFKILCSISIMNEDVVEKAIFSNFNDFEDAMQYYSALASNCDVIITRNEKDFKDSLLPVMNSNTFLKSIDDKL